MHRNFQCSTEHRSTKHKQFPWDRTTIEEYLIRIRVDRQTSHGHSTATVLSVEAQRKNATPRPFLSDGLLSMEGEEAIAIHELRQSPSWPTVQLNPNIAVLDPPPPPPPYRVLDQRSPKLPVNGHGPITSPTTKRQIKNARVKSRFASRSTMRNKHPFVLRCSPPIVEKRVTRRSPALTKIQKKN
ncbi:hypothetical protein V2G26_015024 [Clonostachys chloroleuca]